MIMLAAGYTIDMHSPLCSLLIFVALLTWGVRAMPGGLLIKFSAGLSWLSN